MQDENNLQNIQPSNDIYEKVVSSAEMYNVDDGESPLTDEGGIDISDVSMKKAKNKKKRKKGVVSTIIWLFVIVGLSIGIAATVLMTFFDVTGLLAKDGVSYIVVIEESDTTEIIANKLKDAGVIKYPLIYRVYSKLSNTDGLYQIGTHELDAAAGYSGIADELTTARSFKEEVELTVPDGANIEEIAQILNEKGVCSEQEFYDAIEDYKFNFELVNDIPSESVYYLLEGYLYPDTYRMYVSDGEDGENCAKLALEKMISNLDSKLTDEMYKRADELGYSMHEILTMASIIELEASGMPDEMKNVAQVFYNRLNWNDKKLLGSTPTSKYFSSRYDTNVYEGLPPGPLCSMSIDAINAALYPNEEIEATYFVTDKNMNFYYTNSLDEHNAIIYKLKSQGLWA